MSLNYEEILDKSWDELPEQVAVPDGTYLLRGTGAKLKEASSEDGNDYVLFMYKVVSATDDVDEKALAAIVKGGEVEDVAKPVSYRVWIEQASDFRKVGRHLEKHGVDPRDYEEEGNDFLENLKAALKAFRGTEINGYLTTRTFTTQGGDEVEENQVTAFIPVE